jgi:hypothetical protein
VWTSYPTVDLPALGSILRAHRTKIALRCLVDEREQTTYTLVRSVVILVAKIVLQFPLGECSRITRERRPLLERIEPGSLLIGMVEPGS